MRLSFIAAVTLLLAAACTHKRTLTEQLTSTLSSHLRRLDPVAVVDSVHILWTVPVNERFGRVVDDTVYIREYSRLKTELAGAQQRNEKDSIAFLHYEIAVMEKEIDSISKAVAKGDTTDRFGTLIGCAYYLRSADRTRPDSTMLFVDSTNTLRFTEFLDSSLARTIRHLR
ncbi:MAG TPA: hypothetical protein VKU83_03185 [Puia sp.]|nr:hypothetical protein [Puia sp.]